MELAAYLVGYTLIPAVFVFVFSCIRQETALSLRAKFCVFVFGWATTAVLLAGFYWVLKNQDEAVRASLGMAAPIAIASFLGRALAARLGHPSL